MNTEEITQKEAATRLGVSTSWVRELTSRGVLTRNPSKSYPWPQIREEYGAYQSALEETSDYDAVRIRLVAARAERIERENKLAAGQLVPIDEVEALVRGSLEEVAAALRRCPLVLRAKWARTLGVGEKQARTLISELVEDVKAVLRTPDLSKLGD